MEELVLKKKIGVIPYVAPIPMVLVGANVDGKPNFATVGDCAVLGLRPALVAVSLSATHHTTRGMLAERVFSINVPTQSMVSLVDYFGSVSGRDIDKSAFLPSEPGEETGAPLATACPINLECRVRTVVEIEHRRIFIADVVQARVEEAFVGPTGEGNGVAPLTAIRPILYGLDGAYYGIGDKLGMSYECWRELASLAPK
jgi:flavin reductase (DIM6/NTAB) family NADH-FMN oxidoreductase RutF